MGLTKSEIFTDEQNRLASLFKVLAHPARVAILQYIINQDACICNDLVEELGLAQATISQHLKELRKTQVSFREQLRENPFVIVLMKVSGKKYKQILMLFSIRK